MLTSNTLAVLLASYRCVGIVAYYLGALKYPFHSDDPDQITSNVIRVQPDYSVLAAHGYSPEFKDFVER